MKELVRYEKVNLILLGILIPAGILIWSISNLIEGYAVFIGRASSVYFYGGQSYLVACMWFGAALGLATEYMAKPTFLYYKPQITQLFYYCAFTLFTSGLFASIWFTFNG